MHARSQGEEAHRSLQSSTTSLGSRTSWWIERVSTEVLRAAADPADPDEQFRARIVGAATMGMVDAVTRQWVASPPGVTFLELYEQGWDLLAPLLDGIPSPTD